MPGFNITADSKPVYAWAWTMLKSLWTSDAYWSADDWIAWHKALVARDGAEQANAEFVQAFNNAGFGSLTTDFRQVDPLRSYAQAQGFYKQLFPGFFGAVAMGENVVVNAPKQVADTVGNTLSAIQSASSWLVPTIIVLALILGVWFVYTHFIKK